MFLKIPIVTKIVIGHLHAWLDGLLIYSSKENNLDDIDLNSYMQNTSMPTLKEEESLKLEGMLTLKEAGQTLKNMKK